jgi:hypothetical protein
MRIMEEPLAPTARRGSLVLAWAIAGVLTVESSPGPGTTNRGSVPARADRATIDRATPP